MSLKRFTVMSLITLISSISSLHAGDVSTNSNRVALNGYDVVAYFTQDQAIRGSKQHAVEHQGATYYFANQQDKDLFKANPEKYLPKYGGYCAFAVAMKEAKVQADPRTFKIYNGELYVFFNDFYEGAPFNTKVPWNQNEATMQPKAEKNWAKIR